jgi:hypothetical protein
MSAYRKLAEFNGLNSIHKQLKKIDATQTIFFEKQEIDLEGFIEWRDKALGITEELHFKANLSVRKSWLWVFGMQIFYGLTLY